MLQRAHPIEDGKWCDCFRPKAQGVARSISGSMRKSRIFGRVLIAGDSAVAFPFDRAFDVSAQKIHREIRKRHRGAIAIRIAARSGYGYSGFADLLESFLQNSTDIYDVLLVAGGWNDDRLDQATVSHDIGRLTQIWNLYRHPERGWK